MHSARHLTVPNSLQISFELAKKLKTAEWEKTALSSGKLQRVVRHLHLGKRRGPWRFFCDGEGFLKSGASTSYCSKMKIQTLHIPARSPDLNPIERYWSWVRKQLRRRDLEDLRCGRKALGKMAYKIRVKNFFKTTKAQANAKRMWASMKPVLKEVIRKKGAMARS